MPETDNTDVQTWRGVEVRHLATLDAIARVRSFRGAAKSLGYVQSAVSQHVARLEATVGRRLVERGPVGGEVRLTAAGARLLDHARAILQELRAARVDLAGSALEVGLGAGLAPVLLAGLATSGGLAGLDVAFWEPALEDELPRLVERGRLDLAVGAPVPVGGDLAARALVDDPWVVLVAAGSPIGAGGRRCAAAELAGLPLVAPLPSRASELALEELAAGGGGVAVAARRPAGPWLQAEVAGGAAVALTPRLAVDETDRSTRVVELDTPLTPRRIGAYWNARRRAVAPIDRFCASARELLRARGAAGARLVA